MAYSRVVAEGDGITTQFAVNFALDYLLEADVTCRVGDETDGSGDPLYRDITFLSTNLIAVAGDPAGDGVQIVFERTVDKETLRVDFNNGDQMDEDNLMIAQKQSMMAVHEVLDGRFSVLTENLDFGGFKGVNLGTPTAATDAATKGYADGLLTGAQAAAVIAEAAAAAAIVTKTETEGVLTATQAVKTATDGVLTDTQAVKTATDAVLVNATAEKDAAVIARNEAEAFAAQLEGALLGGTTFDTIAAMRASTDDASGAATLAGYYAGSTDGGGVFVYDAADTTTADDGGAVIVDAVGQRWKRLFPSEIVTARHFGAVLDGTPGDHVFVLAASKYASANDLRFEVPLTGLTVTVPDDYATLQVAHDATLKHFVVDEAPDPDSPHADRIVMTIQVNHAITRVGSGYVWSHPMGDRIMVAGQKESLTFDSLVSQTGSVGTVFVKFRFASLPAGMAIGDALGVLITTGTNNHEAVRGIWQVNSVDYVNNDVQFKVQFANELSIPGLTVATASCFWFKTLLRFIQMPDDGADRGGIDIREGATLNIKDICLSGDSSGTNALSTNGIIMRKDAVLNLEQHMGVFAFQRKGIWGVENASCNIAYSMISRNQTGINLIAGSVGVGGYSAITGNTSQNIVIGLGSSMTAAPCTITGSPGTGVLCTDGGVFITSNSAGISKIAKCARGAEAQTGGVVNLNDIRITDCDIGMYVTPGGLINHDGVATANTTNSIPSKNVLANGALITDASGVAVNGGVSYNGSQLEFWTGNAMKAVLLNTGAFNPNTDGVSGHNLGAAGSRWHTVFALTGTINTSDAREKASLIEPDEAVFEAVLAVPMGMFQWLSSIEEKGVDGARYHYGPTAQGVRDAFIAHGLDPNRYALFCEDILDDGSTRLGLRLDQFDRLRTEAVRRLVF